MVTLAMILPSMLCISCSNEEEGKAEVDYSAPSRVTDVTAQPIAGGVVLSWKRPQESSFKYVKVSYLNSRGESAYAIVSGERADANGVMTATIRGFASTEKVKFSIYACSVKGNNQGAYEFEAAPDEPNFARFVSLLTFDDAPGGVRVGYKNDFDEDFTVRVKFASATDKSKSGEASFVAKASTQGAQFVRFLLESGEVLSDVNCDLRVTSEDVAGNASEVREVTVKSIGVVVIDRSNWSIPGEIYDSNEATIGYSSQEAMGEGATNGRVRCVFDGDTKSFWHSSWKIASTLPQWFIIDMGQDYPLANMEITGRIGDGRGQTGHHIYACSDGDAANKNMPDSWKWVDCGGHAFIPGLADPQFIDLSFKMPTARYVKIYVGEEYKGSGDHAMVSEVNIYTLK